MEVVRASVKGPDGVDVEMKEFSTPINPADFIAGVKAQGLAPIARGAGAGAGGAGGTMGFFGSLGGRQGIAPVDIYHDGLPTPSPGPGPGPDGDGGGGGGGEVTPSDGRVRQLAMSNLVIYLTRCAPMVQDARGGKARKACPFADTMVNIDPAAYAKLTQEADAWVERFQATGVAEEGDAAIAVPAGTKLHLISDNDTIQGLAIRFDTTVSRLRALNKLPGQRSIYERREVLVPAHSLAGSPADPGGRPACPAPSVAEFRTLVKHGLTEHFAKDHGVAVEEAHIYLDMSEFNVAKATAELKADGEWDQGGTGGGMPAAMGSVSLADFVARGAAAAAPAKQSISI